MGILDWFKARLRGGGTEEPALAVEPVVPPTAAAGRADQRRHLGPRYAVVDVETTGLSASAHRIVEIAVVTVDPAGSVLDSWSTRLNPQGPVGATHIHGITERDVANAPLFVEVVEHLNHRLGGAALAAHNARFDLAFLRAEYARAGWRMPFVPALCTLEASTHHLPALPRRRLPDVCHALGLPPHAAHSALHDATATASVLAYFLHPDRPPRATDLDLPAQAHQIPWPTAPGGTATSAPSATTFRQSRGRLSDQALRNMATASAKPATKPLTQLLDRFSLLDALDEGAPTGSVPYLEKLAEALEDGILDPGEAAALVDVAHTYELGAHDLDSAHRAFVRALATEAAADGKITRAERHELNTVSQALAVPPQELTRILAVAAEQRREKNSAHLQPLPASWTHGDPLRVDDRVVFTGCEPHIRAELEQASEAAGVRVMNGVSKTTAMLVTDGSMQGTKAARAVELGTRVVDPDTYRTLLAHLQPACTASAPSPAPERQPTPTPARSTPPPASAPPAASPASDSGGSGPTPAQLRAWGRAHGWELGDRGRLPADLRAAYLAAHPHEPT